MLAALDAFRASLPAQEVPDTLPCPVHLEPGLKFGKGVRTQCMLDALRRRSVYYAELEAMTPEQRAEHDAGIAEFKAMFGNGSRAAMLQAEPVSNSDELPLGYLQGHKDGLEWAAQLAEANHPQTGDWLYDDPIELAKAIRKGPDMPDGDGNSPVTPDCWCRTCRPVTMSDMRFVVCPDCGNKRCPHANDHRNACTGSNELGQIGSAYPAAPQQEVKNG
ncbi:hypothetical protein ACNHT3_000585 [Citrobacter freundii]|nr:MULTISPECIES: hypothetical protein [Citrobacter]